MNCYFFPPELSSLICFTAPDPLPHRNRLFPLFIPFAGCKQRCIFCAQEAQTGQAYSPIPAVLAQASCIMQERHAVGAPPLELAFFGGTFTALSAEDLTSCLQFAELWQEQGVVSSVRCSTRPDALNSSVLTRLWQGGFRTVELGIQSFSASALAASQRGYSPQVAKAGCATVQESGFALGVQLMPGLPGQTIEQAYEDVAQAIACKPAFVRLYPCLVMKNTPLALQWQKKQFIPWELELAVSFLADACLQFWAKGIPVIRMGIAQEPGIEENILAGAYHHALGNMARGFAIANYVGRLFAPAAFAKNTLPFSIKNVLLAGTQSVATEKYFLSAGRDMVLGADVLHELQHIFAAHPTTQLLIPRRLQGDFWGYKRVLQSQYAQWGITPHTVQWWDRELFVAPKNLLAAHLL